MICDFTSVKNFLNKIKAVLFESLGTEAPSATKKEVILANLGVVPIDPNDTMRTLDASGEGYDNEYLYKVRRRRTTDPDPGDFPYVARLQTVWLDKDIDSSIGQSYAAITNITTINRGTPLMTVDRVIGYGNTSWNNLGQGIYRVSANAGDPVTRSLGHPDAAYVGMLFVYKMTTDSWNMMLQILYPTGGNNLILFRCYKLDGPTNNWVKINGTLV